MSPRAYTLLFFSPQASRSKSLEFTRTLFWEKSWYLLAILPLKHWGLVTPKSKDLTSSNFWSQSGLACPFPSECLHPPVIHPSEPSLTPPSHTGHSLSHTPSHWGDHTWWHGDGDLLVREAVPQGLTLEPKGWNTRASVSDPRQQEEKTFCVRTACWESLRAPLPAQSQGCSAEGGARLLRGPARQPRWLRHHLLESITCVFCGFNWLWNLA